MSRISRILDAHTLITDYILGIVAIYCAYGLRENWIWLTTFVLIAMSSFLGGTYHSLNQQNITIKEELRAPKLWHATVYSLALASFFLLLAVIISTVSVGWLRTILLSAAFLKLIFSLYKLSFTNEFKPVIYDYASSLLITAFLYGIYASFISSVLVIGGVAVAFLASVVQITKSAPHKFFDHNDLYHVIMVCALWLIYLGVR